jgi:hypothetical protein
VQEGARVVVSSRRQEAVDKAVDELRGTGPALGVARSVLRTTTSAAGVPDTGATAAQIDELRTEIRHSADELRRPNHVPLDL